MINSYIATAPTKPESVSTDNLIIPFPWMVGTVLAIAVPAGLIILWMGRLRTDINTNKDDLLAYKASQEQARIADKHNFSTELQMSSQSIIHQFELFTQRFQIAMDSLSEGLKGLSQGLNSKDETVNHLRREVQKLADSEDETKKYLDSMRQYLPALDRRDGGNLSNPGDYRK